MAGKALEGREQGDGAAVPCRSQTSDGGTVQCYREDERVEWTLEATMRDIEFGRCSDSPTSAMPMPNY